MPEPTLITFPPSLDCELSRFVLTHYQIPYREQRHILIFFSVATLWHGYTLRFPLLYGDSYRLGNVRAMIDYFDPLSPADRKLVPDNDDPEQAKADWAYFNNTFGTATAVFGYYHLLKHREIMINPLSDGAPKFEVGAVRLAYPVFAGLLRLLLRISPSGAERALGEIRKVIKTVDDRLSDGRPFLMGDHFSLSDMAFAVSAAPAVWPDEYGGKLPPLADTPPEIKNAVAEMREHPAGQFALRIYRERRTPRA
jgi:glutathione S-transferase